MPDIFRRIQPLNMPGQASSVVERLFYNNLTLRFVGTRVRFSAQDFSDAEQLCEYRSKSQIMYDSNLQKMRLITKPTNVGNKGHSCRVMYHLSKRVRSPQK